MLRRLLISDANIIIDMEVGGLVDAMFRLPFEYATPEQLFDQELCTTHADLVERGLQLVSLTPEMIDRVQALGQQYKGVSSHDLEALVLAKHRDAPLLTGDKKLRLVCLEENIDVRGTLWLVEQLLQSELITVNDVSPAYDRMAEDGSRLPWDEVEKQLKRFRKTGDGKIPDSE